MTIYTAPVEEMMFLFDNLKDNQRYNEIEKYKEINSELVKGILEEAAKINQELIKDEFLTEEDKKEYKSSYLYPPRLDMTLEEYDARIVDTLANWKEKNPKLAEKYYFDQVLYWKIPNAHNVTIKRDKKWFSNTYPILQETWKKVCHYRDNLNDLPELQKIADSRKIFYRKQV